MRGRLRDAFLAELAAARRAERDEDPDDAWARLERAHVLSQAYAAPHVQVHLRMAGFALRRRDWRELIGQIPRILLAAPGSWTGRAPRGNTGGADVGIFQPMAIPEDLARLLEEELDGVRTACGR
ncbi:DUF3703 domain-containing protein [Myxococcota bacterium]|nr:DUF3703 domain-containing protein [Myxococcota bacterium]